MMTLEQELTEIDGVRAATVDVSGGAVTTLHVELHDDADRPRVAAAVDGVLRRHGLRSRPVGGAAEVDDEPDGDADPDPGCDADAERDADPATAPDAGQDHGAPPAPAARQAIEAVGVVHRRGLVTYTVEAGDGTAATASCVPREDARHQALAEAVATLVGHGARPHVVEVRRQPVGGREAITVVLDVGEDLAVGTSFERGSTDLALARAVAAALGEA